MFNLQEYGNPIHIDVGALDYSPYSIWHNVDKGYDVKSYLMGLLNFDQLSNLENFVNEKFEEINRYSMMSPCQRAKIGACIHSLSTGIEYYGFNQFPCDFVTSCSEIGCQPDKTCRLTIHAETDAFSRAPIMTNKDYILFCSAAPCLDCAKQCVVRGVKVIFYKEGRPQPEYDRPALSWITRNSGMKFIKVVD